MTDVFSANKSPHFHLGAHKLAERFNLRIINMLAARRVRAGVKKGERAPAGAARGPYDLVEIKETRAPLTPDGAPVVVNITPAGLRTAKIRLPAVLSRLSASDPRRRAAEAYAIAAENVGAMAGASGGGESVDGGAAANDGGVTTRLHHARTLSVVQRAAETHGLALAVRRVDQCNPRRDISASALMWAICIEGHGMSRILSDAGWSGHDRDAARLRAAALECLEDMARALGFVAADARRAELAGAAPE